MCAHSNAVPAARILDTASAHTMLSWRCAAPAPGVQLLPELAMSNELEEPEADTSEGGWEEAACPGGDGTWGHEEDVMEAGLVEELEAQVDPGAAAFAAFAARVARRPQQVVRYCFEEGARPLWPSRECMPNAADVPPCPYCGAPRRFEFQVGWQSCVPAVHCWCFTEFHATQ